MWCAQVNKRPPQRSIFSPCRAAPLAVSGFGIRFCLTDESNVPPEPRLWERALLLGTGCSAEIVYIQNHHDWCALLPLFFSSPQLLPSITNRIPGLCSPQLVVLFLPFVFHLLLCFFFSSPLSLLRHEIKKKEPVSERLGRSPSHHSNFEKLAAMCLWPLWMI